MTPVFQSELRSRHLSKNVNSVASGTTLPSSLLFGTLPSLDFDTMISVSSGLDKAPADTATRGPPDVQNTDICGFFQTGFLSRRSYSGSLL
jgi:hypothetical protein